MTEEQEWASLLAEVFDKLTAKHAAISYKFDKLELSGMVDRNGKKVSTEKRPTFPVLTLYKY